MPGAHRAAEDTGEWLYRRPPDDPGGSHDGLSTPPRWAPPRPGAPVGLPTNRYAENRTSGHLPRVLPDLEWTEVPPPRGVSAVPDRPAAGPASPTPARPAVPKSRAIRVMDAVRAWGLIAVVCTAAVALMTASVATSTVDHQRMRVLQEQNRDLRSEQHLELQRLATAEKQAAAAKAAAADTQAQLEQLRARVAQLEQLEPQDTSSSGS